MFIELKAETIHPPPRRQCVYSSVKNSKRYLGSQATSKFFNIAR